MARRVFGGLVTGIGFGGLAAALLSLALPDAALDTSAAARDTAASDVGSRVEDRAVPRSGLPRLRSDTEPADPARPRVE